MKVSDFDYELPERLIAQTPLPERTASRLLVLHRRDGGIEHRMFPDLAAYLQPGDTLVLNNSRVLPARLFGVKADTGAKAELLLLKQLEDDRWEALVRPGKKIRPGTVLCFGGGHPQSAPLLATVEEMGAMGLRTVRFVYRGIFQELLDQLGQMPLPPYIKETLDDRERYQTVYAKHAGSAAAPTAGLHFSEPFLTQLQARGVKLCPITLHVGLGTFRPVSAETVEAHEMHAEWYDVSEESAALLNEARQGSGKIVAVGTTSARTLETLGRRFGDNPVEACSGWTDIFIYPGFHFKIVDALLTNFHLPKSTLLMLVSALAGRENILRAYREAVDLEYRFFSFGDAMFII
jgi:S-adenosylmethionine:tRNA ribosyltransferase-isomerase